MRRSNQPPFRLRPGRDAVSIRLFDLEAEIMDVVWTNHLDGFCVGDVLAVLEKRRSIAYTTVMTTLARLAEKGVLERTKDGKRYLYRPTLSREAFLEETAREVIDRIDDSASTRALSLLVEKVSEADESELDALEKLIRARRKELRR